jgi:hypothetical protein
MRVQGKEEEREMSLGTSRCPIPPSHPGGEEFRSAPIQPVKGGDSSQFRGVPFQISKCFWWERSTFYLGDAKNLQLILQGEIKLFISLMLQISKWFCRERSNFYLVDATNLQVILQREINLLSRWCYKSPSAFLPVGINLLSHWCYNSTNF